MSKDFLSILLEQAINRELCSMLMHNEPPSREYHQFINFLQDLENRRRYYENTVPPAPVIRTYATVSRLFVHTVSPYSNPPVQTFITRTAAPASVKDPDVIDINIMC